MTQTTRPQLRAVLARVTTVESLTPHMTRVTLSAPEFADLVYLASDHFVRLLLPRASQIEPELPKGEHWWPELVAMQPARRPNRRNNTVARIRPESAEMDIDFVVHGDSGPATRWVNSAAAGDAVGVIDQGVVHEVRADAAEYLIVGDETALPAATGLLSVMPQGIPVTALLEVPDADDRRELASTQARVDYFVRQDAHQKPGVLLLDAVRDWQPTHGPVVAWVAGESTMTTAVRRILVKAGVPKADISFHGYFKFGRSQYDD